MSSDVQRLFLQTRGLSVRLPGLAFKAFPTFPRLYLALRSVSREAALASVLPVYFETTLRTCMWSKSQSQHTVVPTSSQQADFLLQLCRVVTHHAWSQAGTSLWVAPAAFFPGLALSEPPPFPLILYLAFKRHSSLLYGTSFLTVHENSFCLLLLFIINGIQPLPHQNVNKMSRTKSSWRD